MFLVVKSSSTSRKFSKEPHDIMKELRLLSFARHPNVCAQYLNLLAPRESSIVSLDCLDNGQLSR